MNVKFKRRAIFGSFFAFITTGQYLDRKWSGREREGQDLESTTALYIGATGANIEIFYNLIVFTVTFDQYHAAFLNKNFCMVMCLQNLQSKICA